MRRAKFRCGTDPTRPDDKDDLHKNEIAQTERLFERAAVLFYIAFGAIQLVCHEKIVGQASRLLKQKKRQGGTRALPRLPFNRSSAALPLFSAVPARCEILCAEFSRPHSRCIRPFQLLPRRE